MTITSLEDDISLIFESKAPPVSMRFKALKKLNKNGINTYVCINPLIPYYSTKNGMLRKLLKSIKEAGTCEVWFEHLNLRGNKLKRMLSKIKKEDRNVEEYFKKANSDKYKRNLEGRIADILEDFDFKLGGGKIFEHGK